MAVLGPCDETPTDYHRRNLHYRRNKCVWRLLDCRCSSSNVCLTIENGRGPVAVDLDQRVGKL